MNLNTNISQELLESVERYINKQMSVDELKVFENKLKSDSDFKMQVEDLKTLLSGIETQSLKEKLNDFHEDVPKKSTPKVRFLQFRKIAAAAVIVVAIGGFWFFNQNSNAKLYANYFTPDPGLPTTMSSTDNYKFYEAMVYYKQGEYKTAISKWKTLQNTKPSKDTINYFIGVAYLANKNEKSAISFLEETTKNPSFPLVNDAYYYLGLAYLKKGNIDKAKANLQKSTNDNSIALLSELND